MPFRVIITGSQSFTDYDQLKTTCDKILQDKPSIEIVAATQKGAGVMGIKYAKENNYQVKVFQVDFTSYGPQAIQMCYKQMVQYADALIIFWDGELYTLGLIIKLAKEKPIPVREIRYSVPVPAPKIKQTPLVTATGQWAKERYVLAHRKHQESNTPAYVKDHGYLQTKLPDVTKTNGLTLAIVNFINWNGHRATRINTQGQFVVEKYEKKIASTGFRPSATRKGTADISATIKTRSGHGQSLQIEIKSGKDKPSEFQLKEQERERKSGGIYEFISNMEEFFILYDRVVGM